MTRPRGPGPTSRGRVLVTGASVAGPAAAYWLDRIGYDVTVLERSAEPRRGGQNVDVRGLARQVLTRMGLEDAVLAAHTGEVGTRFVDSAGGTVSEFLVEKGAGDGPTAELEILRGELARILADVTGEGVTWWSGDQVVGLDQTADQVTVRLAGGSEHRFDLVVVAEGAGSLTRGLVLDDEPELRRLGMYMAWARGFARGDDRPAVRPRRGGHHGANWHLSGEFNLGTRVASSRLVRGVAGRLTPGPDRERPLPDLAPLRP